MKKQILCTIAIAAFASLFTACEKTTVVPGADAGKDTTVVVPGAGEKTENNTTVVNPAAPAAPAPKTESSTSTTVVAPGASTETKTETTTP